MHKNVVYTMEMLCILWYDICIVSGWLSQVYKINQEGFYYGKQIYLK